MTLNGAIQYMQEEMAAGGEFRRVVHAHWIEHSAFQKFSTDLMKSDIPKFFVDLATVFVDGADNAVKFAGALPTLTAAISGVLSVMQMSGKLKNGAGKVNMPSYVCCV